MLSTSWFSLPAAWVAPAAVCALLLALSLLRRWLQPKVYLSPVDSLLTPAELRFYRTLEQALPDGHLVLTKVRIADLISVTSKHAPSRQRVFRSISSKHVDFVLAEGTTLKPVAAIELDDSSHRQSHRRKRDELVDEVFATAELPLLRVEAAPRYSAREIAGAIEALLS